MNGDMKQKQARISELQLEHGELDNSEIRKLCKQAGLKCGPIGNESMRNTWIKRLSKVTAEIELGKQESSSGSDYVESDLDDQIVEAAERARIRSEERLREEASATTKAETEPEHIDDELSPEASALQDSPRRNLQHDDVITAHVQTTHDGENELDVSTGEESSKLKIFLFSLLLAIIAVLIKYANVL